MSIILGELVNFQGKQLFYFHVCLPSRYGSTLKEKNLLPRSKFFSLRVDLILKALHCPGKQTGSHKSCVPS